jgi:hypothetical protein
MKNKFSERFRDRVLFTVAWWAKEYYGDKICWARLVVWALYETTRDEFEYAFSSTPECKKELTGHLHGCYCGHFSRWSYMPYISLEFMLRGKVE